MIAASAGRDEIVKMLIGQGAEVNAINSGGQCALLYASSKDRLKVCCSVLALFIL